MDYRDLLAARDDAQRRVKDLEMTLTLTRERLRIAEQRAAMAEMNASDRVEGCGRAMTYILDRDATDDDDGRGTSGWYAWTAGWTSCSTATAARD
jgi:hypothetical protein